MPDSSCFIDASTSHHALCKYSVMFCIIDENFMLIYALLNMSAANRSWLPKYCWKLKLNRDTFANYWIIWQRQPNGYMAIHGFASQRYHPFFIFQCHGSQGFRAVSRITSFLSMVKRVAFSVSRRQYLFTPGLSERWYWGSCPKRYESFTYGSHIDIHIIIISIFHCLSVFWFLKIK